MLTKTGRIAGRGPCIGSSGAQLEFEGTASSLHDEQRRVTRQLIWHSGTSRGDPKPHDGACVTIRDQSAKQSPSQTSPTAEHEAEPVANGVNRLRRESVVMRILLRAKIEEGLDVSMYDRPQYEDRPTK